MQYTPVIPPVPGAQGSPNPGRPPVIPTFSSNSVPMTPSWAQPQQFPVISPYVGAHPIAAAPGSYFIPPVALPAQPGAASPVAPVGANGFSADWTGFPTSTGAPSPYMPSNAPPPSHPQSPYAPPGTGMPFQQPPLPGGFPQMHPMNPMMMQMAQMGMGWTPFAMPGMMPAAWPTPFVGAPAPAAAPAAPAQPAAPPAPPPLRKQDVTEFDKVDKFAEGPHYGPVLTPMLLKRVRAAMQINPLLLPAPDQLDRDYIKWNMLFPTAQAQRSSDPAYRSWSNGRHAPATWPRTTSLRLISKFVPWPIEINASDESIGVTCGDVIEGIHSYMNGRVSQKQFDLANEAQKKMLSEAFYHNRSTAHGVPGGRLPQTLLRFDWLGLDTMFGGIVVSDRFVRETCGAPLPCVFELMCLRRYPMTEQEIREQEQREAEADERAARRRRGGRSRATSRATSRTAMSRASSQTPPEGEEDDGE